MARIAVFVFIGAAVAVAAFSWRVPLHAAASAEENRQQAQTLMRDGNYRDALERFRALTLEPAGGNSQEIAADFRLAIECFRQLNEVSNIDDYRQTVAKRHDDDWIVLSAVARSYLDVEHHGFLIAGKFHRGAHRGGGQQADAAARDRVEAMRLYWRGFQIAERSPEARQTHEAYDLLSYFGGAVLHGLGYGETWRLQQLTDLDELPGYGEGWSRFSHQRDGAPVDEKGDPILYDEPKHWNQAKNDGERWRWILATRSKWQPRLKYRELRERADFLQTQFGVETLSHYGWWFARQTNDAETAKSIYSLHNLGDDEALAKLAAGIKRFKLPPDHNPILLNQRVMDEVNHDEPEWRGAVEALVSAYENRRQYPRAANLLTTLIDAGGEAKQAHQQRRDQIVKNWGRLEPVVTQPAGKGATLDYRFRNGKRVEFVARPVKIRELLDDVKRYLSANPQQLEWEQVSVEQLGYRLIVKGQDKYLGPEAARWSLELEPRPDHFDRRVTVTTPLQQAGAYLVTATMEDGNVNRIVVWLADTAIVKKPLENKMLYYVADAVTGKPVSRCNVEFFGYGQEPAGARRPQHVSTKNFAELTDEAGLVTIDANEENRRRQWLAIASTPQGRLAFLGFGGVWQADYREQEYRQVKVFTITDRPLYRPGQKVSYKFWVGDARYDQPEASAFALKSFVVEVYDPRGEKVHTQNVVSDNFGGITGEWMLPEAATLGAYQLLVANHGGGSFRVEEYKKPEFEVKVEAPADPIKLGDKIRATISANYYFGAPVTEAKVKYKVLRTSHEQSWFPPMPWDWLYGPGYWWPGEDYSWYPGWQKWGCARPAPWWFWRPQPQPELVAEREVDLTSDGTIEVEIDSAPAKEIHPDVDHRYQIMAEVTDQSRRTINAEGTVLVHRQPFRVYVWTHRGYYRSGDTMQISMAARTADDKPVKGAGLLRLMRIAYEVGKPVENEVARWDVATNAQGAATIQIKAAEPGQYRLSYEVTAKTTSEQQPPKIEGAQIVVIRGEGFDGADFKFNELELIPDKREYASGDTLALQINANRAGAAVLLFVRPSNGVYLPPQLVQLKGKSNVVEIPISVKDTPNFFVEAVAVHGGRLHNVVRELFVPPERRVFNVEVQPSANELQPGKRARVAVKVTDNEGKPVAGSLVLAIYDKALEYIAGGANVPDIREFFWKWRREHQPQNETSLARAEGPIHKPNDPWMQNLGIFGESIPDETAGEAKSTRNFMARGAAGTPAALAADMVTESAAAAPSAPAESGGSNAGGAQQVQPTLRQTFADTAFWAGALEIKSDGTAEVEFDTPETLTTWKVRAWGMGRGSRVGEGSAEVVTRKNVIVRLQAPRFFVERDEVLLSANVHNYLDEAKNVAVRLELDGDVLEGPQVMEQTVEIGAGGEHRVDWRVKAVREGEATVRMLALTDKESDAMQMTFPVLVHGMLKTESFSGAIRPQDQRGGFTFTVPEKRRPDQSRLEVRFSPTLAGAMVDALPYLVDFPYGCTEQTLNRFLPAVLTQRSLQRMGLDLNALKEKRTNLNAQETGDEDDRAAQWKRLERNPVFDQQQLNAIVKANVDRLTEMQLSDGGWGWFSGWGERSSPHMTALIVRGLLIAQQNDVAVVPAVFARGLQWLKQYQSEQLAELDNWDREANKARDMNDRAKPNADNMDALVYLVLAESTQAPGIAAEVTEAAWRPDTHRRMRDYLYQDRTKLAVYSLATLGLALKIESQQPTLAAEHDGTVQNRDMLEMIMQNLSQYVRQDDENQTAWLDLPGDYWWHWYGSEYEAHAFYLKLLSAEDPESEIAPGLVKYLLNNRKHATYWNSTRDTALVVEAFADYLKATGEAKPNLSLELRVDGQLKKAVEITPGNLFSYDNKLVLTGDDLDSGDHEIELLKKGEGAIYFNGYLTNFSLEDQIEAAGLELKVERRFFKLTRSDKTESVSGRRGQAVEERRDAYDRTPLEKLDELHSGDLMEIELVVDSKNDYEYIVLEDSKPAGFEPVEVRSGYNGNDLGAYVEYRDQQVALFVRSLARGRHSVSYRLRAEIPGRFSALPASASAMYAPELKANSGEFKLRVIDASN